MSFFYHKTALDLPTESWDTWTVGIEFVHEFWYFWTGRSGKAGRCWVPKTEKNPKWSLVLEEWELSSYQQIKHEQDLKGTLKEKFREFHRIPPKFSPKTNFCAKELVVMDGCQSQHVCVHTCVLVCACVWLVKWFWKDLLHGSPVREVVFLAYAEIV